MKTIRLFNPYMPRELPEINSILHSGALSYGKWGKLFEKNLEEFTGALNVVSVNSYNAAMLLALNILGVKPGDEIIASPMSCLASNQPFLTQNINVVWADVDPKTGTLDPESVRTKISPKTKAIFHNHHCGYVGYINEINAIGKEYGIYVVDDAIEAFGSEYKGRKLGNVGTDLTVFSFQTVRLPNTIDGGAVVCKHKEHFQKAIRARDYGIDRKNFRDELNEINPKCDISSPGFGFTMPEINSYLGYIQLKDIEALLQRQRDNAERWCNWLLELYPTLEPVKRQKDTIPNYWVYGILNPNKKLFISEMRSKGFYASGVHLNNNNYSAFGKQNELKGVSDFYSKFVAVPCGWWFQK